MRAADLLRFTRDSLRRQRFRSVMLLLAVAIGVAAVVILVSLGEGARNYVLGEFAFIGKDTLVMFPGRRSTTGGMPPVTGAAARDITLADVAVLQRSVEGIAAAAPLVVGNAPVAHRSRSRDATVLGTNAAFFRIRQLALARGSGLPAPGAGESAPVAVIGTKLARELFGGGQALGQWVRLRDYRFRVVGILAGSGDSFGMDLAEAIFVPVGAAQAAFDVEGLFRVILEVREGSDVARVKRELLERMTALHEGEEDVTVVSPDAMLQTFDAVLRVLTLGVGGIAAISLVVAGILVMNLTLISVNQRTPEIGLLKALGAADAQVRRIFLAEAGSVAAGGALLGAVLGLAVVFLLGRAFPAIPFATPAWALGGSCALAVFTALLFAWLPASRAARLSPVLALGRR